MLDLILLCADRHQQGFLKGLLDTPQKLGIRKINFQTIPHPQNDYGVFAHGADFLKTFKSTASHGLLVFDREFDRKNTTASAGELENQAERLLLDSGWPQTAAVVIDPEFENWVWVNSPNLTNWLGWHESYDTLRKFLSQNTFPLQENGKPARPKEALEAVYRQTQKVPSGKAFQNLAQSITVKHCQDRAFLKLRKTLQAWFPPS